ncbi:hypothetical protein V1512DRAFT_245646 [Lipomyces arxii]|uniref:uncharacterized protein n=1 Tax=Lipomyces arxii TaxID=56418 RepID=UPI0034CE5C6D
MLSIQTTTPQNDKQNDLEQSFNKVLVATAKVAKHVVTSPNPYVYPSTSGESRSSLNNALQAFQLILDTSELSLIKAKDVLERDLKKAQRRNSPSVGHHLYPITIE